MVSMSYLGVFGCIFIMSFIRYIDISTRLGGVFCSIVAVAVYIKDDLRMLILM